MITKFEDKVRIITVDRCPENPKGTTYKITNAIIYEDGKPTENFIYKINVD